MSNRLGNKIAIEGVIKSWADINWKSVTRNVKKLRMRIFRATQQGKLRKAHSLESLISRRQLRRSRRNRKTRYRQPRFDNRKRPDAWLPPSLMSRIHNIEIWVKRLRKFAPITAISQELVRFDTQLMQNPEIQGKEYQQGTLAGYETREYLLEKWDRQCAYCGIKDVPLQVEHIHPRAKGGSNRISNLALSCEKCNIKKGTQDIKGAIRSA